MHAHNSVSLCPSCKRHVSSNTKIKIVGVEQLALCLQTFDNVAYTGTVAGAVAVVTASAGRKRTRIRSPSPTRTRSPPWRVAGERSEQEHSTRDDASDDQSGERVVTCALSARSSSRCSKDVSCPCFATWQHVSFTALNATGRGVPALGVRWKWLRDACKCMDHVVAAHVQDGFSLTAC